MKKDVVQAKMMSQLKAKLDRSRDEQYKHASLPVYLSQENTQTGHTYLKNINYFHVLVGI